MLQTIREHTQGWIAGIIISLIILTFALWGIHSYFVSNPNNAVVAVVNGQEISKEQMTLAYERMRRQIQQQFGYNAVKNEGSLKQKALQDLIETEALKQSSIKSGFAVFSPQVDSYLQSMPQFQVDGQFSVERFQELISSSLLSVNEFLELIRTGLLIDQPRLGVMLTSFSLPEETTAEVALVDQQRNINYLELPFSLFKKEDIEIKDAAINDYYEAHKKTYMTPEQVSVSFVELSTDDIAAKIKPDADALKRFYKENISSYTQPMSWKLAVIKVKAPKGKQIDVANELVANLKSGGSVADAIKQNEKIDVGGDWLTINKVPQELQKTVVNLTNNGEVAGPLQTSQGVVVVVAEQVRKPIVLSFSDVEDKVRKSYVTQQAAEKFAEKKEQLADLTYSHPDSLQYAADEMGLAIKVSDMFSNAVGGSGIAKHKKVREAAFSSDTLELQNNSDVIQTQPGTVIVLRIKKHIDANLLPLSDVSSKIKSKLLDAKLQKLADNYAVKLADRLNAGESLETVSASLPEKDGKKPSWKKLGYVGRYSTKADSAVLEAAFKLPHPDDAHSVVYGVSRVPDGFTIIAMSGVKDGTLNEGQLDVFSEQIQSSQGLLEYTLYKTSQLDNANIKLN